MGRHGAGGEGRGALVRDKTHLLLSGQPSPSTASSSKVLRVVTSDFQNFHLTANKVCDWFVDVLIDDTVF